MDTDDSCLFSLCMHGQLPVVREHIEKLAQLKDGSLQRQFEYQFPLTKATFMHFLAYFADVETIQRVVFLGANVLAKDVYGGTPLTYTIYREDIALFDEMMRNIDKEDLIENADAVLTSASSESNPHFLSTLINKGLDINHINANGFTPLHTAVYTKKPETVKWLLAHGANPAIENNRFECPVDVAKKHGYSDIAALFE